MEQTARQKKSRSLHIKVAGWHIYVCNKRRQNISPSTARKSSSSDHKLKALRNNRYRHTKGCCEVCGQHCEKTELQMHHILPYRDFPDLKRKKWNLLMLCPHCHFLIHHNLVWNVEMMQQAARRHSIDLGRAYKRIAANRWEQSNNDKKETSKEQKI